MDGPAFRVVLLGAERAGKSELLTMLATAANVPIEVRGAVRCITTITAARTYTILDAETSQVEQVLAGGAEATILVVAAVDGPLPTTRRHVELARQSGAPLALIVLNDRGIEDVELTELVEMECRELATKFEMRGDRLPVVRTMPSRIAHTSSPVPAIAAALDAFVR
jgi:translation elongation factor EF-Tu-like GTPase